MLWNLLEEKPASLRSEGELECARVLDPHIRCHVKVRCRQRVEGAITRDSIATIDSKLMKTVAAREKVVSIMKTVVAREKVVSIRIV